VLADEPNMFVGLGFGSVGINTKIAEIIPVPLSITAKDNAISVTGGYIINQYVSVDLTYQHYGDIEFKSPLSSGSYRWQPKSLSLNANFSYPVTKTIAPFVSIGTGLVSLNESEKTMKDDTGSTLRYGAGIEFKPSGKYPVSVAIGYSAELFSLETTPEYKDSDVTLDSYYVNVKYKF